MPDRLDAYRRKRSAGATPEPFGAGAVRPRLFVVQKHAARRLHWDFRLELGGTLRSWAVPRGPSLDPAEKRLAVEVEDHPVEYADFEGVIPAGNYGAGEVIVWDRGAWIPLEDPEAGIQAGKLLFELRGYKLRGVWTLVRTKAKGATAPKEWLLIKKPDAWAAPAGEDEAERGLPQESILSGLSLEELRSGSSRSAEIRDELLGLGAPRRAVEPAGVEIMLAAERAGAFSAPGWLFELKYDGFRVLAAREGAKVLLRYRQGSDATATYPEVARALAALPFERLVLDGEIVIFDDEGRPSFQRLQKRAQLQRAADIDRGAVDLPATLVLFDLLGFEDFDLRPLPLRTRKALLQRILPRAGPLRFADHIETAGEALLEEVRARGLEGIVAKKADGPYRAGRHADWLKVRIEQTADLVVVGFTEPRRSRPGLGSLDLAFFEGGGLVYCGRVGTGFAAGELEALRAELEPFARKEAPCTGPLPPAAGHTWVEPRLLAEVRYLHLTEEGLLRQPAFLRLRPDKRIEECTRPGAGQRPDPPAPPDPAVAAAGPERRVVLSNLDKVFFPEDGLTKGDLLAYYRTISPHMLPYLRDRPLVLTRYPDGIHGKSFYQKDAPGFVPGWIRTVRIFAESPDKEIDYFVCDDLETLLYVVNLGSIPLHIWSSRASALGQPDWCILDLDPKEAPFAHVLKVARAIYRLCEEIELPSFVKTSGQAGLHVLIPLGGQFTYEQSRTLGLLLSRLIVEELPEIATLERVIGARGGKVYLDFLQNRHGQLLVAPFSVRPRPGAPVSTPLVWSEVGPKLDPARFTIRTVPARLARRKKDPMLEVLAKKPDLAGALARLEERIRSRRRKPR